MGRRALGLPAPRRDRGSRRLPFFRGIGLANRGNREGAPLVGWRGDFIARRYRHMAACRTRLERRYCAIPPLSSDDVAEISSPQAPQPSPRAWSSRIAISSRTSCRSKREVRKYRAFGSPFFPDPLPESAAAEPHVRPGDGDLHPSDAAGRGGFHAGIQPGGDHPPDPRRRDLGVGVGAEDSRDPARVRRAAFPEAGDLQPQAGTGSQRWWRYRRVHRLFGWKFWASWWARRRSTPDLEAFWSRARISSSIQGYGLTETAPIVTLNHPFHTRQGTVGKPIGGVEVKIADDGEILVRGENVTTGYFNAPRRRRVEDGWFHTGDIGALDAEGRLAIRGRKKE